MVSKIDFGSKTETAFFAFPYFVTEGLQFLDSLYGTDLSIQNSEEQSVYASVELNENDNKEILLDKIDYIMYYRL